MNRPHDLLWLADPDDLIVEGLLPPWATKAWLAVAPVVVRRATLDDAGHVPVGLRGAMRNERCAARLPAASVRRAQAPEAVVGAWLRRGRPGEHDLPCLAALARLAPLLNDLPVDWGVTGGVGFTLASGFDVLRTDSDLDLLLRAPSTDAAPALHEAGAWLGRAPVSVDVQVETPFGAFALKEWLRTGGPVLLKTAGGPLLVDDPWQLQARHGAAKAA